MFHFFLDSRNKEKSTYIWNTCASMLNAFKTVFILMIISRIDPVDDAGIFTIAFAVANLMLTIGLYGVRQFQVSDVNEKYNFKSYFSARIFSCIFMIISSVLYVGYYQFTGLYAWKKSFVILLICLEKGIDAFEDVLHGRMQQKGRLDVAGKILSIRLSLYIITYIVSYVITENLIVASLIALMVSLVVCFLLNRFAITNLHIEFLNRTQSPKLKKLLLECLPLFISAFLVMYVSNAPKYAIDKVLSSEEQACFTYIFMPVFVIGLLSQFVYQPIIGRLSVLWSEDNRNEFLSLILKQVFIILILAVCAVLGGYLLGIPVLSLLYGVDLSEYRMHLLILLLGGAGLAYVYFFQMILTVIRKQKFLVWGYLLAFLAFMIFGTMVVRKFGLMGISVFYTLVMTGLAVVFVGMAFVFINKRQKQEKKG